MRLGLFCAATLTAVAGGAAEPPQAAAAPNDGFTAVATIPLTNPGFESARRGPKGDFEGWSGVQHAGDSSYRFTVDREVRHDGQRSLRIDNIGREPFGALEQTVPVGAIKGKTIRFSGWIKTRDANGKGAALIASAESSGALIAHNFMTDREITGTQDWRKWLGGR